MDVGTGASLTIPLGSVTIDGKLKAPSGFAFGPEGDLYVAERFDQRVRRFSIKGKKKGTFIENLPDIPEFLVYVPDQPAGHRRIQAAC